MPLYIQLLHQIGTKTVKCLSAKGFKFVSALGKKP